MKLFLKISNLCNHNTSTIRTDRQTDRQTTCDRNTALCTKLHRAVMNNGRGLVGYQGTSVLNNVHYTGL